MKTLGFRGAVTLVGVAVLFSAGAVLAASHPLDPLDDAEISRAVEALRAGDVLPTGALVISLDLAQPEKESVLAWRDGGGAKAPPRRARAIVRHEAKSHVAVVDLASGEVLDKREIEPAEGQVAVSAAEFVGAMQVAFSDARFREALGRRGIERIGPETLFCAPRTVGNFGRPEEQSRRLVKVDCFDLRDNPTNAFAAPIEGLFATIDLDTAEVVEIVDLGVVPVPRGTESLAAADQPKLRARPEAPAMPDGFSVDDWTVSWENWRFHLGWSTHSGLLLGDVSYADAPAAGSGAAGRRSVLYEGHLSELYVPYMDPTDTWSYRNYFDEGDYGIGSMASPLEAGADCPQGARYLSPWTTNVVGEPTRLENRICIFVRVTGEPTWRHQDISGQLDSRPDRDLVVRFLSTVGNYDYLFDWILDSKGRITFRGGATGLDAVKAVTAQKLGDPTAAADTAYGPLIAPGLAGIQHDHFFSLRLDLDIDGAANRFVRDRLVAGPAGEGSARTSIWRVQQSVAEKESDAVLDISLRSPSLWRLQSTERTSALGYPTSYQLVPGNNALPLADPRDSPLARAGFANHHLWVTPRRGDERFAAGEFPNQSLPGQGLPAWTSADRPLVGNDGAGEDLVLWYTMGFHHVPSSEDWPVYSVGWHSVTLKPYNFFDRNPAMDLPE